MRGRRGAGTGAARPIERAANGALLAHVAAAKFAWRLPLHCQTQMLAGYGIKLDRSTLVHRIGRTAWWLRPLYDLLALDRHGVRQDVLRRHAATGAGSNPATNADRAALVLRRR